MNTIIIANLKNFTLSHEIVVMDEAGNVHYVLKSSMKDMAENIVEQSFTHGGAKVKLMGNKKYAAKLCRDVRELSLAKYDLSIDVEII